jgi:acyl-CoA reductase-like NAD-dependent aldehyde dehydrogenase
VPIPTLTELYVDGVWRAPASDETLTILNPSTGKALSEMAVGAPSDVDAAVASAQRALTSGPWPKMSGTARRNLLLAWAAEVRASADDISEVLLRDMGAPTMMAHGQVMSSIDYIEHFAGWADKMESAVLTPALTSQFHYTLRKPVGVVAAIVPWNAPVYLTVAKLAPALAAGCTVVLKPSELAPLSPLELVKAAERAGFPPGVVNVVTGTGAVGAALVEHPGVDKVSFTGGTTTGAHVAATAGRLFKRVTLELGGKSANVIFADADLDAAAQGAVMGMMVNTGQQCIAGSRVLVQRSVYDQVLEKIIAFTPVFAVGLPDAPGVMAGPLIDERSIDRVLGFVDRAKADSRVAVAGERLGGDLADGFFVSPSIVADVSNDSYLAQNEVFGPVTAVIPFDDAREAAAIANDTEFGLAGGVWTSNLDTAHYMAAQMRTGTVWVNSYLSMSPVGPFGGFGASGLGREGGSDAIDDFSETTQVVISLKRPR